MKVILTMAQTSWPAGKQATKRWKRPAAPSSIGSRRAAPVRQRCASLMLARARCRRLGVALPRRSPNRAPIAARTSGWRPRVRQRSGHGTAPVSPAAACSSRSAACATRQAPMPRAEPLSVWAAAAATAGSAPAIRSSMSTVWRAKISKTSRSRLRSPERHAAEMIFVDDHLLLLAAAAWPTGSTELMTTSSPTLIPVA